MLVLRRRLGEEVILGGNIRLTVMAMRGNQVPLGFTAPPGLPLRRKELCPKGEEFGTLAVRPTVLEAEP